MVVVSAFHPISIAASLGRIHRRGSAPLPSARPVRSDRLRVGIPPMTEWPREVFIDLDPAVRIRYSRTERPPISYAIVLETQVDGHWIAIRLWDNAHSVDEHHEHEYTSSQGTVSYTHLRAHETG